MGRLQEDSCTTRINSGQGARQGFRILRNTVDTNGILSGERMEIHLNISFPRVPCELLSLDVMDVSGEQQTGVMHGVSKVRLASVQDGGGMIDVKALEL